MTSYRKDKNTFHIQQTPKTEQSSTKISTSTPNSLTSCSAATNKQNCMSAEVLSEKQQNVELLQGRISELESLIHVTRTVNSLLQTKIDNQEQHYSQRLCLVINELEEPGHEDEIQKITATIKVETCIN